MHQSAPGGLARNLEPKPPGGLGKTSIEGGESKAGVGRQSQVQSVKRSEDDGGGK